MGKDKELQDAFKMFMTSEPQTFIATVLKVDKQEKVITVEDTDGLDFDNVRLTSVISSHNKVVQFPKENTTVLVSKIGDDDNTLFVSAISEVESIEGVIENTEFHIDKNGYTIARDSENLKEVLNDWQAQFGKLCDEVNKIVVSVGVTPNVAAITQIKNTVTTELQQRLNTILKV
ncbi:hypothetical protein [Tenacibaculum maritimum]|uniref:hypothetical protein n=1 Tax=Tenacibaculum maritimum TaxID=107401 RepID=UPI0012E5BFA6|nr:hypothetical protein [Tenacibaculum maritimum]CAA0253611.1 conserved hypothetical protein [Tenacibaculum maritimum]